MADKNMGSADFRGSDSEDDELAALREAALRSKKNRFQDSRPASDSEPLPVPSMPVLPIPVQPVPVLSLPPPSIPVQSLPVAPLVTCPAVSHFQRHPFKVQDKDRFPRNGSQNFVRAPRSNLIVIQTVPLDEEKSTDPKRQEAASLQEKITLVRPQDKWAPTSDVKTASPAKPKVPTKFDRYEESESDTEEEMSATDDSESEYIFSSEKHILAIDETDKGVGTPDADQLPCHSSPTDAFNKQEDDPGSLKLEPTTDVDVNLANLNSVSNEQLCEQSMLKSNSQPEDTPRASFEEPLSPQQRSRSSHSSRSSDFQAKEKIQARSGQRTQLKSPVSSLSPVSSGSLSRSSSLFTPCLDKKDERLPSPASPARQSLHTAFLDQSASLISSRSSFSSSPWSDRGRQSPPIEHRGSKGRSRSRDSSLQSDGRSASFGSPVSSRSRSRSRSPVGLKSPRRLKSTSRSWSSTPLESPLRNRSKTRSRSPPKTKKHSRSPVDRFARTLESSSPEHSSSRLRSKSSSGLNAGKHLNSRSQKPVPPPGHGNAFHRSNSPTLARSYESEKSPQRTSYGHIRSKDTSRSPGYAIDEKTSPRLIAKDGTLVSSRSSRRSRSPLKFRTLESSWSLKQSRYSGRGSTYRRSKSPSPQKLTSGNSSPDFARYRSSPVRLPRSRSPWKRFSGSRSPPSRLARSRSRLSRFSRSGSPPPVRRSRSRSPSVPRSFSPGIPQEYKPSGISKNRNGDSSHSYRDDRRLRHSPADIWRSGDIGATSNIDAYGNRFRTELHGYSDFKELHRNEHYFEKKPDSRLGSTKALPSQSGRSSDCLRYDKEEIRSGDKQRPKDVKSKEQTSRPRLVRDSKEEDLGDRQKPKRELLKGKNCERRRENQNQENLTTNKTFADDKNLTRADNARPGNDTSCAKSDRKDYRLATKESEPTVSQQKPFVRTSIDSEIPLSRRRFSLCDDSDSESEAVDHRQKHYTERKDLGTRGDPVLQKRNDKQLQNSRFMSDGKRHKGYNNHNRFAREGSGTRQDYIPPLMEGVQFRSAAPRGQSPRRPAKRPRSRSPPVKSVLSLVKLAKDSDSAEAETKKLKPSLQLPVEKRKAPSQLPKRNYVSDETKDSPGVLTVGRAGSSSRGRPKARTAEQTAHDKIGQVEPVGDQRMIQITFNHKMNFDGTNAARQSVHERLGSFDVITTTGKEKKVVDKSGSSLAISEEKKFADLRDLIGDKSRHAAYDLDGGDGNNSGQGDVNNDLYARRSAKTIRRRRKFNKSSSGNLEARPSGRPKYR